MHCIFCGVKYFPFSLLEFIVWNMCEICKLILSLFRFISVYFLSLELTHTHTEHMQPNHTHAHTYIAELIGRKTVLFALPNWRNSNRIDWENSLNDYIESAHMAKYAEYAGYVAHTTKVPCAGFNSFENFWTAAVLLLLLHVDVDVADAVTAFNNVRHWPKMRAYFSLGYRSLFSFLHFTKFFVRQKGSISDRAYSW